MAHDRHVLYEASVQGVDYDLDFLERVYRRHHGHSFRRFREDFCGTAAMAAAWVRRSPEHRAWGVDLDREVLAWARSRRLPPMREAARRLTLVRGDVRTARVPRVDLTCAFNFSWWVFKQRAELLAYLRSVRRGLRPGGMLIMNMFGGTEAMEKIVEPRRIPASQSVDGQRVPSFIYEWDQTSFNPVDHHITCSIHFKLKGGKVMRHAFRYDWRLWTLPEIRDALAEAGFRASEVYVEGWDDAKGESDDKLHLRKKFENQESWLAYVVGLT